MMMQDIAMHVLDIGMNSLKADSKEVKIVLKENSINSKICFEIIDDGRGMDAEEIKNAQEPFYTSRTTRRFGLGIPFIKAACEMCDGRFLIESKKGVGTRLIAEFNFANIDCPPLGNIADAIVSLMVFDETINLIYEYSYNDNLFSISTKEIQNELEDISISEPSIQVWLIDYIKQNMTIMKEEEQS